jgi:UDPglucose 6-dehydrogenase
LDRFLKKLRAELWVLKDKTIGILGLAFKPNTDDIRSAPAIDLIRMMRSEGAKIRAYDPKGMEKAQTILKDVTFCKDPYEAAKGCDALLVTTEWPEFRTLDLVRLKKELTHPLIIDGRNIFTPDQVTGAGLFYRSIGR